MNIYLKIYNTETIELVKKYKCINKTVNLSIIICLRIYMNFMVMYF